jgi:hypothetical protein
MKLKIKPKKQGAPPIVWRNRNSKLNQPHGVITIWTRTNIRLLVSAFMIAKHLAAAYPDFSVAALLTRCIEYVRAALNI